MLPSAPIRSVLFAILLVSGSLKGDSLPDFALTREEKTLPVVEANDNRAPAGTLIGGVLRIQLVVDSARWYPGRGDGAHVDLLAFSEAGKPPRIPGPLIRVPVGTTIEATITNSLSDSAIYVWGFATRPAANRDSIPIKPGESRVLRYLAGEPGTYLYRATIGAWDYEKGGEREQLAGVIVIDSLSARTDDRIFMINIWSGLINPRDTMTGGNALAINGRSWPHTERITATVGDTLRWRVVNASIRPHPMHLHGFYFTVTSRGNIWRDTLYDAGQQRLGVTEDLSPLNTMAFAIAAERSGNWLFHCHLSFHVLPGANLPDTAHKEDAHSADPERHMAGLVVGIIVKPRPGEVAEKRRNVRRLHLYVQEGKRRGVAPRALGYVLQRGKHAPTSDSVEIPGSVIVLRKNEPTDIVVVNRLKEPTSVHWHGIELESYSDGVPGWSGNDKLLAPMIAPNDSFTAHLTLPRAGTFIYHTHLNDIEQITSGLYGAMVVLDPKKSLDSKRDHIFVAGWDGSTEGATWVINGDSLGGPPIEVARGVPQRFRFINIGPAGRLFFSIRRDTTVATWRALAKDGATLNAVRSIAKPAIQRLGVGEMYDAEFMAQEKGEYVLAIGEPNTRMKYRRRLVVK